MYLSNAEYAVNGTALPYVDFDVGESYAGLLPLSYAANETRELFHWFFPSSNPDASDEILVWLNGGPGCSSLEGLLQENGPFKVKDCLFLFHFSLFTSSYSSHHHIRHVGAELMQ
jgi:carboxypeptidase D